MNRPNIGKVVRHFHLAFKGMEGAEIYDVLMELLIAAANGYDPHYKQKVKQVVEVIEDELPRQKRITAALVNRHLEFDCDRHLRMLARAGFLEVVPGKGGKEEGPVETELVLPAGIDDGDVAAGRGAGRRFERHSRAARLRCRLGVEFAPTSGYQPGG